MLCSRLNNSAVVHKHRNVIDDPRLPDGRGMVNDLRLPYRRVWEKHHGQKRSVGDGHGSFLLTLYDSECVHAWESCVAALCLRIHIGHAHFVCIAAELVIVTAFNQVVSMESCDGPGERLTWDETLCA